MVKEKHKTSKAFRPPIVAVLGHVDHGKTTLLDTIRKANVASREHGGITQHIGAYQIHGKTPEEVITFIDTPGHEAFAKMRSRGATAADIAILVVAADDSVKPQTKESIAQIKAAGVPIVVAVNKIDLPGAKIDKVKQDLAREGVQVEGFGGDVPVVAVSAKAGTGIKELLETITLVGQMKELLAEPSAPFEGFVVETRIDKGKGMVATVIVKKGTLTNGTLMYEGQKQIGKVRAMFDEYGKGVAEAPPAKPVEILGFSNLPSVGSVLTDIPMEAKGMAVSGIKTEVDELPDFLKPISEQEAKKLNIVLKADVAGSLEAIVASLHPQVKIVGSGIGDISEADIHLGKSTKAVVIGFNVKFPTAAERLAQAEKVICRMYTIIYELLDELSEVAEGLKEVILEERELGAGNVIAEFPFEKTRIAGTAVTSGRLARGDSVKVMRNDAEIGRAKIKSLRHGKEDVTKAEKGQQCGILFDRTVDFTVGDAIMAVTV